MTNLSLILLLNPLNFILPVSLDGAALSFMRFLESTDFHSKTCDLMFLLVGNLENFFLCFLLLLSESVSHGRNEFKSQLVALIDKFCFALSEMLFLLMDSAILVPQCFNIISQV